MHARMLLRMLCLLRRLAVQGRMRRLLLQGRRRRSMGACRALPLLPSLLL